MNHQISYETNPKSEDIQVLNDGIMEQAEQKKGMKQLDFFAFFIRDENGKIMGRCGGDNMYGGLYVGQLWVAKKLRGKGYGTQLMQKAEALAKESQCNFIAVNTFDWEALDFYKKLGFDVEFERKGFDKNSIFYFLRKDLKDDSELNHIEIRAFEEKDISILVKEFARHHWHKPQSTFDLYWHEQTINERFMWVALHNGQLAGYVTLKWSSYYQSFKEQDIPEIMDLNVLPPYRNKGIGTQLLKAAERLAATRSHVVGLGVGLYGDYGNAQKLYIKKGYMPDGRGVTYNYQTVVPGDSAPVDDDLVLWFKKDLS